MSKTFHRPSFSTLRLQKAELIRHFNFFVVPLFAFLPPPVLLTTRKNVTFQLGNFIGLTFQAVDTFSSFSLSLICHRLVFALIANIYFKFQSFGVFSLSPSSLHLMFILFPHQQFQNHKNRPISCRATISYVLSTKRKPTKKCRFISLP